MVIKLIKASKVTLPSGSIVNVKPAEGNFLLSVGSAVAVKEEPPKKGKKK